MRPASTCPEPGQRSGGRLPAGPILHWYAGAARELPWRAEGVSAWEVLVSEVMLQQTPVARVLPIWQAWIARWPNPAALAGDSPAEALRAWARLGYPRRALRLHAAAGQIVSRFDGSVPASIEDLQSLPGVGSYTARAVAAFAFGARTAVVDTNVARVMARAVGGRAAAGPRVTAADRQALERLLPRAASRAARLSVAVMELGALVCTAVAPACPQCPVRVDCAWWQAGSPAYDGPRRRAAGYVGTDRQVRGLLLEVLRTRPGAVVSTDLDRAWTDPEQRSRALDSLIADGLIQRLTDGRFALPGDSHGRHQRRR